MAVKKTTTATKGGQANNAKETVKSTGNQPIKKSVTKETEKVQNNAEKPIVKKAPTENVEPIVKMQIVEKNNAVEVKKTSEIKVAEVKKEPKIEKAKPQEEVKEKAVKTADKPKDEKKHILFVSSEAYPFAGTGGLGEVMGSLPKAINAYGDFEARIVLPLYESFPEEEKKNLKFLGHLNVPLAWRSQYCGLFSYDYNGVVYYFVDNEYYFKRPNLYGYYDDGERFAFLSRAVCELLQMFDWRIDVLHCQDWQTALVPIYYKLFYMYRDGLGGIKTIFTIHNIEYQGKYSKNIIEDVFGIPAKEYLSLEHKGCINLMKAAIDYSDSISTVSPTYAKEIMEPFYAHGLENILLKNSYKLRGILNGINTDTYNPMTNAALFKNFSVDSMKDKAVNKAELQKMLSLPVAPSTPLIAIISRLVAHKGLDLIRIALDDILKQDVQVIVLGKGDSDYENYFTYMQHMFGNKICSVIAFNKDLSHKIYAGADMFLMPSKSEPCGLSQMMATRYGTVPIVRATGGLKDSIVDCGDGSVGNGFVFNNYDARDMQHAIDRAVGLYNDYHDKWDGLTVRAMNTDFSWEASAREYIKFYKEMLNL